MAGDLIFNDPTFTFQPGAIVIHNHGSTREILDGLARIESAVGSVRQSEGQQEQTMSAMQDAMDRITREVQETRDAQASAAQAFKALADQIRGNANNPAALNALADSLDQGQTELAAAVVANTPTDTSGGSTGGSTPPDDGSTPTT